MMSTQYPLRIIEIILFFVISRCRYAPGTSKPDMSRFLCASMISVRTNAFKDTVGDETLSPYLRHFLCLLTSAQFISFTFPHFFSFIRFTASSTFLLCSKHNVSGSMVVTTGLLAMSPLSIFLYYFIIAITAFYLFFLSDFADIYLNMTCVAYFINESVLYFDFYIS